MILVWYSGADGLALVRHKDLAHKTQYLDDGYGRVITGSPKDAQRMGGYNTDDVSCGMSSCGETFRSKDCIRTKLWKAAFAAPKVQY